MTPLALGEITAPYDMAGVAAYLNGHATPGVECSEPEPAVHRRVHPVGDDAFVVTIDLHSAPVPSATISGDPGSDVIADVAGRVRRVLDVTADPELIATSLAGDDILGDVVATCPGVRAPGAWDGFEMLVKVIIGQQVSVAGARTMTGRLAQRFGSPAETSHVELTHAFPTPQQLVDADLESEGFIAARSRAIRNVAAAVIDGTLSFGDDVQADALIEQLVAQPGIGPWTATITAFRVCGDRDLFPPGDLVLRKAAGRGDPVDSKQLDEWSRRWAPVRSYAAHLLWRSAYLD